ncbi:isopenicillin N-CoA epimerase [Histoplasma capsulatum var. duboisii H88]|uniref:Isopenicillin N-CoA epimerase n=1 Tax=Ajellomyces capsulatus (strain H88) TaxID=544711 RepID=A0A8A1LID3_AJEC8|nr:isopenicillin N-CoA epimerase [Histoplasma capsulatum var. duboisii H88]
MGSTRTWLAMISITLPSQVCWPCWGVLVNVPIHRATLSVTLREGAPCVSSASCLHCFRAIVRGRARWSRQIW